VRELADRTGRPVEAVCALVMALSDHALVRIADPV
jgi:hypothetical protein